MQLNKYTDYSLRTLIYLGVFEDRLCTTDELSKGFTISKNHLVKIVHRLSKLGFIETIPGRNGGIRLAKEPSKIKIVDVITEMESGFKIAECFESGNNCSITPICKLKEILKEGLDSFINSIEKYTLADVIPKQNQLKKHLAIDFTYTKS